MPVNDTLEQDLREALRPHRPDPEAFADGVGERIARSDQKEDEQVTQRSALLSTAASFVPVPLLLGGRLAATSVKAGPTSSVGAKVLGYAALPAICVFLMFGAFLFSVLKIRSATVSEGGDVDAVNEALRAWWHRHWWVALPFYAALIFLPTLVDTQIVFSLLVVSAVALAFVLTAFAKAGLATRRVIANTCTPPLLLLAICMGGPRADAGAIHLIDQQAVSFVLYAGLLVVSAFGLGAMLRRKDKIVVWVSYVPVVALVGWMAWPLTQTPDADDILTYVESLDRAEHGSATWRDWEMTARWLQDRGIAFDESKPRALVEKLLRGQVSPYTLGHLVRTGLVRESDYPRLQGLEGFRKHLRAMPVGYPEQADWAVRVLLAQGRLTNVERDVLFSHIHATLEQLQADTPGALEDLWGSLELLDALGHPIDVQAWRTRVHDILRACHSLKAGGFELAGGFQEYDRDSWGSIRGTWLAVQLMKRIGAPDELDLRWVRSYLRYAMTKTHDGRYVAAAASFELEALPETKPVTWFDWLRYERTLIAAVLLVLLCLYAVLRSPRAAATRAS